MATMTVPMHCIPLQQFEIAEKKVERVDAGLTFAQGMNIIVRAAFEAIHVTSALHGAVSVQKDVLNALSAPHVQNLPPEVLASLAEKIGRLVALDDHILSTSQKIGFRSWGGYLHELQDQKEHLENIAESFRMACDDEALGILASIANDIATGHSEQLVGAMHA